jgi:hypothetical protein
MNVSTIKHRVMERACVRRVFTWNGVLAGSTNQGTRGTFITELLRSVGHEGESLLRAFLWDNYMCVSNWSHLSSTLFAITPRFLSDAVLGMSVEILQRFSTTTTTTAQIMCMTPSGVLDSMRIIAAQQPDLETFLMAFDPVLHHCFCTQHDRLETARLLLQMSPPILLSAFVERTFSDASMHASTRACSERQQEEDDKLLVLRLARLVKRIGHPLPMFSRCNTSTVQELLGTCQFRTISRTVCMIDPGDALQNICKRPAPLRFSLQQTTPRDRCLTRLNYRLRLVREKGERHHIWLHLASFESVLYFGDRHPDYPGVLLGLIAQYLGAYTPSFDVRNFIRALPSSQDT